MDIKKLENEVPFDQFSRQFQVAAITQELKGASTKALNILDIGGYKGRTADFLHAEAVTVVDLFDVDEDNYVKGSALQLPFEDKSFDLALSFDVLEHIPSEDREKFVSECARVSKLGFIICAPNKTEVNEASEEALNELYKSLHDEPHPWLKEHIEYGIPDFDQIEMLAAKLGFRTTRFPSNKAKIWLEMQQAIFTNSEFPMGAPELLKLNRFYNQNFRYDGGDNSAEAYRQILCCMSKKNDAEKLIKKLGNLNKPISSLSEIELSARINKYYVTLVRKGTQLAKNYEDLRVFEKNRADQLSINNQHLQTRINRYEKVLPVKALAKTRSKLRRDKK
jgi:predicted SAM-dependent methyltransferase